MFNFIRVSRLYRLFFLLLLTSCSEEKILMDAESDRSSELNYEVEKSVKTSLTPVIAPGVLPESNLTPAIAPSVLPEPESIKPPEYLSKDNSLENSTHLPGEINPLNSDLPEKEGKNSQAGSLEGVAGFFETLEEARSGPSEEEKKESPKKIKLIIPESPQKTASTSPVLFPISLSRADSLHDCMLTSPSSYLPSNESELENSNFLSPATSELSLEYPLDRDSSSSSSLIGLHGANFPEMGIPLDSGMRQSPTSLSDILLPGEENTAPPLPIGGAKPTALIQKHPSKDAEPSATEEALKPKDECLVNDFIKSKEIVKQARESKSKIDALLIEKNVTSQDITSLQEHAQEATGIAEYAIDNLQANSFFLANKALEAVKIYQTRAQFTVNTVKKAKEILRIVREVKNKADGFAIANTLKDQSTIKSKQASVQSFITSAQQAIDQLENDYLNYAKNALKEVQAYRATIKQFFERLSRSRQELEKAKALKEKVDGLIEKENSASQEIKYLKTHAQIAVLQAYRAIDNLQNDHFYKSEKALKAVKIYQDKARQLSNNLISSREILKGAKDIKSKADRLANENAITNQEAVKSRQSTAQSSINLAQYVINHLENDCLVRAKDAIEATQYYLTKVQELLDLLLVEEKNDLKIQFSLILKKKQEADQINETLIGFRAINEKSTSEKNIKTTRVSIEELTRESISEAREKIRRARQVTTYYLELAKLRKEAFPWFESFQLLKKRKNEIDLENEKLSKLHRQSDQKNEAQTSIDYALRLFRSLEPRSDQLLGETSSEVVKFQMKQLAMQGKGKKLAPTDEIKKTIEELQELIETYSIKVKQALKNQEKIQ